MDGQGLGRVLSRMLEANIHYYEGLGRLTTDYLRILVGAIGEVQLPVRLDRSGSTIATAATPPAPSSPSAHGAPPVPVAPPPPAPTMVLEAEAGGQAVGAFLVENRLVKRVSAPVVASSFVDPSGREIRPALVLEPEVVTLDAGEQILVRVMATVPGELETGVSYRGDITVPGVWGGRVHLVLRRRPSAPPAAAGKPTPPRPATHRGRAPRRAGKAGSAPASASAD